MRTPEEVKKGLECRKRGYAERCGYDCAKCDVYVPRYLIEELLNDALAYIQQLERERDAAVEDIPHTCKYCANESQKWIKEEYPRMNVICCTCIGNDRCNWQWRGVQEEET